MIEYLLLVLLAKYRNGIFADAPPDPLDRCLEPYAGLDHETPARQRPDLRIVK